MLKELTKMQQQQVVCEVQSPKLVKQEVDQPMKFDFVKTPRSTQSRQRSRRQSETGKALREQKMTAPIFEHDENKDTSTSKGRMQQSLSDLRVLKKVNSAELRFDAKKPGTADPQSQKGVRKQAEDAMDYNSQLANFNGKTSMPKNANRSSLQSIPAQAKGRQRPTATQQPGKFQSDIFPNLMSNKHQQNTPLRSSYQLASFPSTKNGLRNSTTKPVAKSKLNDKTAGNITATDFAQGFKQTIAADKKSRASIQILSKTTDTVVEVKKQEDVIDTKNDIQTIINKALKPTQTTQTKAYEHSVERIEGRQTFKGVERHPSKSKQPFKPVMKERVYASNYLDGNSSLTTGLRQIQIDSKKMVKRQNQSSIADGATTDAYSGYQKASASLVDQLLKQPAIKQKKSKRGTIEKKSGTEWVNSPASKGKDTRHSAMAGLNRDSSLNPRNDPSKNVNFPSYFKGGSAAGQRHTVGLKEAAMQMIDNRFTKTLEKTRAQNVSPIVTNIKATQVPLHESSYALKKKAQIKKKESPRQTVFISKTVAHSVMKQDTGIEVLESFYRERQSKIKQPTVDAEPPKAVFLEPVSDFQRAIMPEPAETKTMRLESPKSDLVIQKESPRSPLQVNSNHLKEENFEKEVIKTVEHALESVLNCDIPQGARLIESTDTIKHFTHCQSPEAIKQIEPLNEPVPRPHTNLVEPFPKTQSSQQVRELAEKEKSKQKFLPKSPFNQHKANEIAFSPMRNLGRSAQTSGQDRISQAISAVQGQGMKKFSSIHQVIQEHIMMRRQEQSHNLYQPIPSHLYMKNTETQRGRQFKYQVLNGNNGALVRRVMQETRSQLWVELSNNQQNHYHFRWAPISKNINFERLSYNFVQMVNHVEGHHEVSTKNELFHNVKNFMDERNLNVFHCMPITFYIKVTADKHEGTLKKQLQPFKQVFNLLEEFKSLFDPDLGKAVVAATKSPRSSGPSTPKGTGTEMSQRAQNTPVRKKKKSQKSPLKTSPYRQRFMAQMLEDQEKLLTYQDTQAALLEKPCQSLITRKGRDYDYANGEIIKQNKSGQVKRFSSKPSGLVMPLNHFIGKNVWILKPTSFNRGKGIHVVSDLGKLKKLMKDYSMGREAQTIAPAALSPVQQRDKSQVPIPVMPIAAKIPWGSNLSMNKPSVKPMAARFSQLVPPKETKALGLAVKSKQPNLLQQKAIHKSNHSAAKLAIKSLMGEDLKSKQEEARAIEPQATESEKFESGNVAEPEAKAELAVVTSQQETENITDMELNEQTQPQTETEACGKPEATEDMETDVNADEEQPLTEEEPVISAQVIEGCENSVETLPQPRTQQITVDAARGQAKNGVRTTTFIIQKYIEQPALINNRKFDIRVWVLLDQNKEVYFFEEGYLRLSGYEYSMTNDNLDEDGIHLTNNAIQKNLPNYGTLEDGNQKDFEDLRKWLKQSGRSASDFDDFILPKMKYYAAICLYSARKKFNTAKRKYCFELFGLDYILDSDLNVFLIECNTNPCIEESSKILKTLLPRMLDDMFKLTIDQVYISSKAQDLTPILNMSRSPMKKDPTEQEKGQSQPQKGASIYHVPGYDDTYNMWQKIATLRSSNAPPNPIYVPNPSNKFLVSQSERMIQLVNQYEMRVAKSELIDKLIRRDQAVNAHAQVSFTNY